MEEREVDITFEEALAVCVQYYVDRGNSEELATTIVNRGEREVLALYHAIQEEKEYLKNHPIDEPAAVFPL